MPINGEAARTASPSNRPVPKVTTSTVLAASSTSVLRWMSACVRRTTPEHQQKPDQHRSGREDADLFRSEEPAHHERLNNGGSLSDHQADRGHRRAALEHTAQAGRGARSQAGLPEVCVGPPTPAGRGLHVALT